MSIEVNIRKDSDGFVLVTTDEFKDVLAGPFKDSTETLQAAKDLDLTIKLMSSTPVILTESSPTGRAETKPELQQIPVKKRAKRVPNLAVGDLFRVGTYWYRLLRCDEKSCDVEVIGEGKQAKLPLDTEVTEVSVLSMH